MRIDRGLFLASSWLGLPQLGVLNAVAEQPGTRIGAPFY